MNVSVKYLRVRIAVPDALNVHDYLRLVGLLKREVAEGLWSVAVSQGHAVVLRMDRIVLGEVGPNVSLNGAEFAAPLSG